MKITRRFHLAVLASLTATLVAACGGAFTSNDFDRVIVAGDSLADVGTYGLKFTVQNSAAPAAGFQIWPELVATDLEVGAQCNYYVYNGVTFVPNTRADCTNYAIAGARIVNPQSQGGTSSPLSIPTHRHGRMVPRLPRTRRRCASR